VLRSARSSQAWDTGIDIKKLVNEAVELGFEHVYFTGGEPFLIEEIYEILSYASERDAEPAY
jgi:MoaA/NifB/PqqE/SkfB family radical SAM enzyme